MSNALSTTPPHTPTPAPAPRDPEDFNAASPQLMAAIRVVAEDGRGAAVLHVLDEAVRHLEAVERLLMPASPEVVFEWVRRLGAAGLEFGPKRGDTEDAKQRCRAIWQTCQALPAGVWTVETRLAFQAAHDRWPPPARVMRFLAPYRDALTRQRRACKAIVEAADRIAEEKRHREAMEDAKTSNRTPEALQAVSTLVSSLRVPTTHPTQYPAPRDAARKDVPAFPISTTHRLAAYEDAAINAPTAAIREASATRAAAIRARLNDEKTEGVQ